MADLIDLVDKKKLIRNIHQILDKHINASADYPAELFEIKHELLGSIDIEQSFFTQDSVNRWIPCSEMLPETGKCVLACVNGELEKFSVTAYRDKDCDWISDYYGDVIDSEITHWMTLPEPPEEGDNDA